MPIKRHTPRPGLSALSAHFDCPDTDIDKAVYFAQTKSTTHTTVYWLNVPSIQTTPQASD